MTFEPRHLAAAVMLHAMALLVLAGGLQCSARPQRPTVIKAVLLDPSRQELARLKRLAEERKRAEADRTAAEEARRTKAAADKKAADKKAADKKLADKKAADQKAAETARQKRAQAAAREREQLAQAIREEDMRREVDREAAARAAGARQTRLDEWAAVLTRHVADNFRIPPGAPATFQCQVRMQLLPDGTVTNAKIVRSCGSPLLDQSVEDAVHRSSPMPRPADPSVFDRDLTINFQPNP
ncbi:MAG: cell envelope integrity protein TolA [Gammaproteobacteria bacterium]